MRPAAVIGIAYLLGSVPFGYLIVRAKHGADVRQTGSGGTGATNVSRRAGKGAGVVTLLLDALKGAAAVLIASWIVGVPILNEHIGSSVQLVDSYWWITAAAIAVIVGHMFPVWLGFRGGKGVATGVGVFLVLAPLAVVGAGVIFLLLVWRTRYVSLGSIIAAASIPLFVWLQHMLLRPVVPLTPMIVTALVGAALIVFAHRANIGRLVQGNESRFK